MQISLFTVIHNISALQSIGLTHSLYLNLVVGSMYYCRRVDMTVLICRLSTNTFFKGMKGNTFVIPHAKIMMYTCPEYLHIQKYTYDPLIVPTVISRQDAVLPACQHDGAYIVNIIQCVPTPTCSQKYFLKI